MRITAADGTAVTLQPHGWEFPAGIGDVDDDQWLVINGHVVIGDRDWSFTDPCLLLSEAYELAGWLQAAADGSLQPAPAPSRQQTTGHNWASSSPCWGSHWPPATRTRSSCARPSPTKQPHRGRTRTLDSAARSWSCGSNQRS